MSTKQPAKTAKVSKKEKTPKLPMPPKKERGVVVKEAKVELVSFTVSAVIPTQQYGNIQPRIEVTAPTIEQAREFVMPVIEDLYKTYAEAPLSGKEPKFYGAITETEKKVAAPAPKAEPAPAPAPATPASSSSVQAPAAAPAPTASVPTGASAPQKPEPVMKAEKAISLAVTPDALGVIENQIKNSVKIPEEFKADLQVLVDAKRAEVTPF